MRDRPPCRRREQWYRRSVAPMRWPARSRTSGRSATASLEPAPRDAWLHLKSRTTTVVQLRMALTRPRQAGCPPDGSAITRQRTRTPIRAPIKFVGCASAPPGQEQEESPHRLADRIAGPDIRCVRSIPHHLAVEHRDHEDRTRRWAGSGQSPGSHRTNAMYSSPGFQPTRPSLTM